MKNKKISVIMGIYNCSPTLDEAIESIINQTYPIYEIFYAFFAYRDCGVSV